MTVEEAAPSVRRRRTRRREAPAPGGVQFATRLDWCRPTADELDALPIGARRSVAVSQGLRIAVIHRAEGWTMNTRRGIGSEALAGLLSASRGPVQPRADR